MDVGRTSRSVGRVLRRQLADQGECADAALNSSNTYRYLPAPTAVYRPHVPSMCPAETPAERFERNARRALARHRQAQARRREQRQAAARKDRRPAA